MLQPGQEVADDRRFEFGENWTRFLRVVDETRITEAERSLKQMLEIEHLNNTRFLDIGSGSGLFSLVARRLGARVHSFDNDPHSVACTLELKRRYFPEDTNWTVERGSVLDVTYLKSLGTFNVVYAWGVLHHTGAMWRALENVHALVGAGGRLFIAIYNDQGGRTIWWKRIKRTYNGLPKYLKIPFAILVMGLREMLMACAFLVKLQPQRYLHSWTKYHSSRGMSRWHDLIDWVGGYPFEVAKPEQILDVFRKEGLVLLRLKTCGGGLGCNEYVFGKPPEP